MQVKTATFDTVNITDNFEYQFFQTTEKLVFLGTWDFGTKGPDFSLSGLPRYTAPAGADKRVIADANKANALLLVPASTCYDVFTAARANHLYLINERKRLAGLGYNQRALIDKVQPMVQKSIKELDLLGAQLWALVVRCDKTISDIESAFPDSGEGDLQTTMFDLEIVRRLGAIEPWELKVMEGGDVVQRYDDCRVVQAFYRTPSAVHGLSQDTITTMRKVFAAKAWPFTTQAVETLRKMIDRAAATVTSAAVTAEGLSGAPAGVAFSQNSGLTWLSKYRGGIATDSRDFDLARMVKRFPDGVPSDMPAVMDAD